LKKRPSMRNIKIIPDLPRPESGLPWWNTPDGVKDHADEHAALMAVLVALETWMGAGIDDPHAVNFCAMKQAMKHARSLIETPDTQPTPQPSP